MRRRGKDMTPAHISGADRAETTHMETCMKTLLAASFAALLLFTIGCSGEPSEADIRAAFERDIAESSESLNKTAQMFGGAGKAFTDMLGQAEIHSVKKIGCVEATDAPGYVCDVEVDMTVPLTGRKKDMTQARFVKGPDGWVVTK